jgi:hypothetical protein
MATVKVGAGGVDIPDGAFESTLLEIEVCAPTDKSTTGKPWLKYTFTVYDGSPEGVEMTAASSTALSPKAKARPWMEALLGRRLEPGEEIDLETIPPKDCQVVVKNDPETGFAKITDGLPPRSKRPGAPSKDGVQV